MSPLRLLQPLLIELEVIGKPDAWPRRKKNEEVTFGTPKNFVANFVANFVEPWQSRLSPLRGEDAASTGRAKQTERGFSNPRRVGDKNVPAPFVTTTSLAKL